MPDQVHQLPRGRHGLSRDEVLASQRGRILAAMAEAVAEKGFARATVADVISRAGVSRETFYEQFSDKEQCFLAALDTGANGLAALLQNVTAPSTSASQPAPSASAAPPAPSASAAPPGSTAPTAGEPLERLERMLDLYLTTLAAAPKFAKVFLIDAYGAGPAATARRIELQSRFVQTTADVLGITPDDTDDWFLCEVLVAAISSLATARIGTDRAHELPSLREPLIQLAGRIGLG